MLHCSPTTFTQPWCMKTFIPMKYSEYSTSHVFNTLIFIMGREKDLSFFFFFQLQRYFDTDAHFLLTLLISAHLKAKIFTQKKNTWDFWDRLRFFDRLSASFLRPIVELRFNENSCTQINNEIFHYFWHFFPFTGIHGTASMESP